MLAHARPRPGARLPGGARGRAAASHPHPHRPAVRPAAAPGGGGDGAPAPPDVATLKATLLRLAAPTARGKAADRDARVSILRAVEALEAAAPAQDASLDAAGLSGEWGLVYSGPGQADEAAAADSAAYERRTGGLEGPVVQALRPLGKWFVASTGTAQVIDAGGGAVSNVASFRLAGGLDGELDVIGTAAPAPPGAVTPGVGAACGRARTDVAFTALALRFGRGAQKRTLLSLPLTAFNPRGWIETTFLEGGEGGLRISRGDKGSVFVAVKRKAGVGG